MADQTRVTRNGVALNALVVDAGGSGASGPQPSGQSTSVVNATGDALRVQGDVADGASDSGNPVKIGARGIGGGTRPNITSGGMRQNLYADNSGGLLVSIGEYVTQITGLPRSAMQAFGTAGVSRPLLSLGLVDDGANLQAQPGNSNGAYVIGKGGSSIATGQMSVPANTATLIVAARAGRQKVTLSPTTSAAFYQGGPTVSAATGLFIPAGGTKTTDTAAAVYAFSTTAITISFEELF